MNIEAEEVRRRTDAIIRIEVAAINRVFQGRGLWHELAPTEQSLRGVAISLPAATWRESATGGRRENHVQTDGSPVCNGQPSGNIAPAPEALAPKSITRSPRH